MDDIYQPVNLTNLSLQQRQALLGELKTAGLKRGAEAAAAFKAEDLEIYIKDITDPKFSDYLQAQGLSSHARGFDAVKLLHAVNEEAKNNYDCSLSLSINLGGPFGMPEVKLNFKDPDQYVAVLEQYAAALSADSLDTFNRPTAQNCDVVDKNGHPAVIPNTYINKFKYLGAVPVVNKAINDYLKSDPQRFTEFNAFKEQTSYALQKAAPVKDALKPDRQKVNDVTLILLGKPQVKQGVISHGPRAGKPYCVLEMNAFKPGSAVNGSKEAKTPPTYYKLAVWSNDPGSNQRLANLLQERMQVVVSGVESDRFYQDRSGQQKTAKLLNVDSMGLRLQQQGIRSIAVPSVDEQIKKIPMPLKDDTSLVHTQNLHGISVKVIGDPVILPHTVTPDKGIFAGTPCRELSLNAYRTEKGQDVFYRMSYLYPTGNANLERLQRLIKPGMALCVSGSAVMGKGDFSDGKQVALHRLEVRHLGLDLKHAGMTAIEFSPNLPSRGKREQQPPRQLEKQGVER